MDFMILYESKARELESACLLKVALESEGFSVAIFSIYSLRKSMISAKVIIVPHLYDDEQVYQFICKYKHRRCKVINMQYEQVMSKKDIEDDYGFPRGDAIHGLIFAWGEHENNRYVPGRLPNSVVTGCLAMDLNLPKYDDFFIEKKDLLQRYGLDKNKKVVLFISSFSLAEVGEDYLRLHYGKSYARFKYFSDISRRSKTATVHCLERLAKEEGFTVVYRPHIAEYDDPNLKNIESNVKNFHIISGESVRQWIRAADFLVTWFSTTIVDAYYANKPCIIFRPEEIPRDMDVPFLAGAETVSKYEDLCRALHTMDDFPIAAEEIHSFYSNMIGEECLPNVVKTCKEVYYSPLYEYEYKALPCFKNWKKTIRTFCVDILFEISRFVDLTWGYALILSGKPLKKAFFTHIQKELYQADNTINSMCLRLTHGK